VTDLAIAEPETFSNVIDTDAGPSAAGGGQVSEPAAAPEPASLRSDLETVFREDADKAPAKEEPATDKADDDKAEKPVEDKPAKDEAKPDDKKADDKPATQRAPDGKFAPREAKPEDAKDAQPAKGERRFVEAPQSFLPQAKEVWRNTPHAVQAEVARMVQEHTTASEQTRVSVERYESIRQYDELARQNGRDLSQSLERMNQVENLLQRNPLAGLNAILSEIGPRKADGQPYSLYEVAQFVAQQDPNGYQQMIAQGQPQQQQRDDPRIEQLQKQLAQVKEQAAHQTIVEPFAREHPRFAELEQDIAFFLQSGRIPASLSPQDRLAAAYDMAERINPPSRVDEPANADGPAETRRAVDDLSGSRSIKSSPGSVTETYEPKAKRGESARDSLLAEMRRMNR
jgi:hypothetical protein